MLYIAYILYIDLHSFIYNSIIRFEITTYVLKYKYMI